MKKLSLSKFLEDYKEVVRQHVIEQFRPLYTPADRKAFAEKLSSLKRRPYSAQVDAIAGLTLALKRQPAAIMVGEMGVGKTLIACATVYLLGVKNTLILCPPHLVQKWEKEIKDTLPQCEVVHIRSITGLCKSYESPSSKPRFFILSRERAKLSYRWKPAAISMRRILRVETENEPRRVTYSVLACPACYKEIKDREGIPLSIEQLGKRKYKCLACQSPLWQADRSGVRRYAIADFIKQHMKGFFGVLVADELHEYKAKGSAQGLAVAGLARASKKVLALTGTLFGGYSTTLFHLLYRLSTEIKKQFGHNEEQRWASRYGILERITKVREEEYSEDGTTSRRRSYYTRVVERPGVSPEVMFHLIDKAVFMRLGDLAVRLPPYQEEVILTEMEPLQEQAYRKLASDLILALREQLARGNKSLLGAYLQSLLSYPDQPFHEEMVVHKETGEVVARAPALPEDVVYPKEQRLLELVKAELSQGRKVLLYVTHTESRDITGRLQGLLRSACINAVVLKSHTVSPEQREGWIKEKLNEGLQVLISQPRLVQTGLDLVTFPTIIFYEPEYSVYTLRQASRRSWRIGQNQPVKVYFMAYQETLQEKGLHLIAAKVRSALAVEGELLDSGLSAFNQDQDFFLQLARSIVERDQVQGNGFEAGISHPIRAEQELDRYLLPEGTETEEEPVLAHGNGKAIASPALASRLVPRPDSPPASRPQSQVPLFTGPGVLEQLTLF